VGSRSCPGWQGSAEPKDRKSPGSLVGKNQIELGLVDELRIFRYPVVVGGGTPFLPPVTEDLPLDLIESRMFGSRVIYGATGAPDDPCRSDGAES
jgi:hypothetical protein